VSSNPKGSPYRSMARAARKRPGIQLTLSREAMEYLAALAEVGEMSRSEVLETLLRHHCTWSCPVGVPRAVERAFTGAALRSRK
jgi:hypothetical protein